MTYLLTQIFISLLLAGLAGGAFGWILHGFKANQRERELKSTLARHNTALAQAQQERQMIADDYDEMKIGLESRISELQYENRKLPDLEENLEKSQQLVIQMIKKHEAETGELATLNNELHNELESLKAGNKKAGSAARAQALYNTQSETGSKPDSIAAGQASAKSVATTASTIPSTSRQPEETSPQSDVSKTLNRKPDSASTVAASVTAAVTSTQTARTSLSKDNTREMLARKQDVNLKESSAATSEHTAVAGSADSPNPGVDRSASMARLQDEMIADSRKHWDDEASEQKELLALESEIEEMRAMDGHLTGRGSDDIEHERELDLDQMQESNAIDLARDIDEELATPVVTENVESPSAAKADAKSATTVNTAITSVRHDAEDDSDKLRTSLREKFSSKSDDDADDLQIIHGIGPVIERSLNDIGITNFNQLATLTRQEIEEVAEILKIFPGRIERDNWIGNARRLVSTDTNETSAGGSDSSHSKPDKEELENA